MSKSKKKIGSGAIGRFLRWPLILSVVWACLIVHLAFVNTQAAIYAGAYFAAYLLLVLVYYFVRRAHLQRELIAYAADYHCVQSKMLSELEIPFAVLDESGHLLWGNDEFLEIIEDERAARKNIQNVIPSLPFKKASDQGKDVEFLTEVGERKYRAVMRRENLQDAKQGSDELALPELVPLEDDAPVIMLYLHDETELRHYMKENQEEKAVVALLYVDNYDEVLESVEEARRSMLTALVDRRVSKYMSQFDALVKRTEPDKYLILFRAKYLDAMKENKFQIMEDVKSVKIGNDISPTISIGISAGRKTYTENYEAARAAIDLALGRGGDQTVLREGENITYFGGKNASLEKNTRVKARMKAHALKELIEAKDHVVIMGHAMGDADSLGAAIGVYRIAKTLGKRAYIVLNERTRTIRPLLGRFENNPEYEEELFVRSERAKELVDAETLLAVVDTNRPNFTECPQLLNQTSTIVNIDHHRRIGGETIDNAVLAYVEPFASSACEMVCEILQYTGDGIKLKPAEADALYAGIIIDTDHFLAKTGVRTFEAAAYLRRNGADMSRIRKAFRSDRDEVMFRANAIGNTEIYRGCYAIGQCTGEGMESPTVLGAQVANELLDITGIKASFVLTPFNDKIYISARSIDELNVQLFCERLGGGGNPSVAGAQLPGATLEEATERVKAVLDEMTEKGEI
ncbi:MAG: DHH family phosphoesterase [Lachnospiraceae bacterium]|nr:DHH family phosphoesterase [Lachnospiraceae bacterium]